MVSMMSSGDKCLSVNGQVTLATTALMPSVVAVMNLATLLRTFPRRFLHQEHHATTKDLTQGIDTPMAGGTDHSPAMVPDIEDITADHSPIHFHTATEAEALKGTPNDLLPATTAAHTTIQLMATHVTPHAMITTCLFASYPTLTIFPAGATHATPQTRASLAPAAPSTQHKILSPKR